MQDPNPYRAGELLQIAATIAAIAVALATFYADKGPSYKGVHFIALSLLTAGFFSVIGSGFALRDLYAEIEGDPPQVLHMVRLSIIITVGTYIALLADLPRSH